MSNLGLDLAFRRAGGRVIRTNVGDRYVLEAMRDGGFILGGEQSGHIINLGINTTGDGIITALQLMSVIRDSGKDLKELAGQVQKMPQALVNVVVADKEAIHTNIRIQEALIQASRQLGDRGRILIRPSGTESKVRVMVECEDLNEMEAITQRFVDMVKEELAGIDKTKRG
jgi:phosphoglucosamine mutase